MPTLGQLIDRLPMQEQDALIRSMVPQTAYERVQRTIDPNWNRQANQYGQPIELLQDHLGISWKPGLHFEVMNEHLVALARREINSLIITMPPQHGKSTFCSVVFPAWYLGEHPTDNIIGTAYNSDHAGEFSGWSRDIVADKGGQLGLHLDPLVKSRRTWSVLEGGTMRSAGLNAGITGKPCDLLIGDDPIKKPSEAFSPAFKRNVRQNWSQACETRLQPDGIRLLVMTRWATDDLVGWLLENQPGEWTVLHLEAICRRTDDPIGRALGEHLWDHFNLTTLKARRKRVGEYVFMTMYQGKPHRRPPEHAPYIEYELLTKAGDHDFSHLATKDDPKHKGRHIRWLEQPLDIACDVARSPTGDRLVFAGSRGNKLCMLDVKPGQQLMATANEIIAMVKTLGPRSIRIDDTGVGGGVSDRVIEIISEATVQDYAPQELIYLRSVEVIKMVFGGRAFKSERFADIRTEMWFNIREQLSQDMLDLPEDQDLFDDLTAPQMGTTQNGRLKLESKDLMARRGIRSTDLGDAVAMAIYPWNWFELLNSW